MAKNDSSVKLDSEGMPFIPGFSDVKGVEMDLGKLFFKPRIVGKHAIAQGYLWDCQEFPNHVNDDGRVMEALIMKLSKDGAPVALSDAKKEGDIAIKNFGQEIFIPLNHAIMELKQWSTMPDVCHEIVLVTLDEEPLKAGKDGKPKTIRGFRWKIVNANVPRAQVLKDCVPAKLKAFAAMTAGNGAKAPSLRG
jgi:hypothetical protein